MNRIALLALALAAAAAAPALEWNAPAREVFDNGMVGLVYEDHSQPLAAVRVYVKAGSIYEGRLLGAGVSHFVEHVLGEGTTRRTKEQLEAEVEAMGGASNAYTWKDVVCYHLAVRSDQVDRAIDYLEDTTFHSTFPAAAVEQQREIILNEIRMGQDEPRRVLQKGFYYTMFREHPARYPIIGYEEIFKTVSRDELYEFYRSLYVPERSVVVVTGDVDGAAVMARLRATFGALPRGKPVMETTFPEPPQVGRRDVVMPMDIGAAYMWIGFRGAPFGSRDSLALDVLATIAAEGRSSRLYRRILQERGWVTNIGAWNSSPPAGFGFLCVYADGEALELDYAEEGIISEMLAFADKKVSKEELARAKKLLTARYFMALSTTEDVAEDFGVNELYYGAAVYGRDYTQAIEGVTADEVRDAARRYIRVDNMTVAKVVPNDWKGRRTTVAAAPAAEPMTKAVLPNGLRLLIRRNPARPTVSAVALIGGGGRVAAPGKAGIAEVSAEMLTKGTRTRSGDDITRAVEDLGAGLAAGADADYVSLSADCLAADFPKVFEVFADCLTNSTIPGEEFDRERDRLLSEVQSIDDDWELHAERLMLERLYPRHPYRYFTTGTEATVGSLAAADGYAYYEKYVTPDNIVVAVVGDVDPAAVTALATEKLGKWYPPKSPAPLIPADPAPSEAVEYAETGDQNQAVIYMGWRGVTYNDADAFALRLLDATISGVRFPGGRLYRRLRDEGLVYVMHAFNQLAVDPGYFGLFAATSPATVEKTRAVIAEELERAKTTPPTEEEMALARENWLTVVALDRQDNGDVAFVAARDEFVGLGYDWRDDFAAKLAAVQAEDVAAAARKYLVNGVTVVTMPAAAPAASGKE